MHLQWHPAFWSEDRQAFVPAGELRLGETLRAADGNLLHLVYLNPRSDSQPVYNLEIDGEHVYYVSSDGLLVQNSCSGKKAIVIGESMSRIKDAFRKLRAKGIDARWYQAWKKNFPIKTKAQLDAALARNRRWIKEKIAKGYSIFDKGINPERTKRSPFYRLEKSTVKERSYPTTPIP